MGVSEPSQPEQQPDPAGEPQPTGDAHGSQLAQFLRDSEAVNFEKMLAAQEPAPVPQPDPEPAPPADPEQPASEPQDTPQALPDAPAAAVIPQAQPVRVDNVTRRSGDDALEGLFCEIVSGPFAGRWGVFDHVVERDITGYPRTIMVISRDEKNERLTVGYDDTRPSLRHGGR